MNRRNFSLRFPPCRTALWTMILLLSATVVTAADVQTISHGERVELTAHTVSGKYTLFDFYADWCGPCKAVEPHINHLAARYPDDLAIRKVDIINWKSAVATQHRLSSIPHLKLYDVDGKLIDEGNAGPVLATLEARLGGGSYSQDGGGSSTVPFFLVVLLLAVAAGLLFFKGQQPASVTASTAQPMTGSTLPSPSRAEAGGIWFVMIQGSLEGPFNEEQLDDLRRRRCIDAGSRLRRRGEAEWHHLSDVLDP